MMLASKPKMLAITGICFLFVFIACNKSTDDTTPTPNDPVAAVLNLPASPFNYANPALPGYLSAPPIQVQINTPAGNAITDNGATLGRVLFYDKNFL